MLDPKIEIDLLEVVDNILRAYPEVFKDKEYWMKVFMDVIENKINAQRFSNGVLIGKDGTAFINEDSSKAHSVTFEPLVSPRMKRLAKLISEIDKKGDVPCLCGGECGGASLCDTCTARERWIDLEEIVYDYHKQCSAG